MAGDHIRVHCGLALAALLAAAAAAEPASPVVPPGEKVDGLDQREHAVRWWQWANLVPPGVRPYQDPTGAQCGLNQSGAVWFLAGTDGTADTTRHCRMPAGKYVFLPIINMLAHSRPGKPLTCQQARVMVAANNDHLGKVEVTIDGQAITRIGRFRQSTPHCFDAFPVAPYLERTKSWSPAATDGYWLMIRPLSVGIHVITVRARYDNPGVKLGDLEQVFEYQLQVEDEKETPEPPTARPEAGSLYL
jgi:hypothetical protein